MTIDEAIRHCEEVAGEQQERADSAELIDILDGLDVDVCKECAADHRQLAEWLKELKEAKRLLKLAVEDLNATEACDSCEYYPVINSDMCQKDDCYKWRYADEAEKLLGDERSLLCGR